MNGLPIKILTWFFGSFASKHLSNGRDSSEDFQKMFFNSFFRFFFRITIQNVKDHKVQVASWKSALD